MAARVEHSNRHGADWLEEIAGAAPLLLIAPHGGRAGPASAARLHPKVNDLYTAEITRELAALLGAPALINAGMDRNDLDCNRINQLAMRAPWLLEMIADRVEQLVERADRVQVVLVHGWNIIEPRVDIGLGVRAGADGTLRPVGAAHVSAGDKFINGILAELIERLSGLGVIASYGSRYPGGGRENLLQAFTGRNHHSDLEAMRRLARLASAGAIDAVQLEISAALRLPGGMRHRLIDAIAASFADGASPARGPARVVVRQNAAPQSPPKKAAPVAMSSRVGVEFYDPAARIGGMASFDFGPGAAGARIMFLLGENRVALFTGEGRTKHQGDRISLGPLELSMGDSGLALSFRGPVIIVPDGRSYLSIERALGSGHVDEGVEVTLDFSCAPPAGAQSWSFESMRAAAADRGAAAGFGRACGRITFDGVVREIDAVARVGVSFSAVGSGEFLTRRMIWAGFGDGAPVRAAEVRSVDGIAGCETHASFFESTSVTALAVGGFDLNAPAPDMPPETISALLMAPDGKEHRVEGSVENFICLSRPGPQGTRIYTALGFARYAMGLDEGAGMFEFSRRSDTRPTQRASQPGVAADAEGSDDD